MEVIPQSLNLLCDHNMMSLSDTCSDRGMILYVLEPKAGISWIFLLLASAAEGINIANSFKRVWDVWVNRDCSDFTIDHCCQHKCIEAIILVCTSLPLTVMGINNKWMNELKASYWLTECFLSTQQIQKETHEHTDCTLVKRPSFRGACWVYLDLDFQILLTLLYYSWF